MINQPAFPGLHISPAVPAIKDVHSRWMNDRVLPETELFYVLEGGFVLNTETHSYIVRRHQMALLAAGVNHSYWRLPNQPFSLLAFRFRAEYDGIDFFRYHGLTTENHVVHLPPDSVMHCYSLMLTPHLSPDNPIAFPLRCAGASMLCAMYAGARVRFEGGQQKFREIIAFMHAHSRENLRLETLAARFHFDSSCFCKAFKKHLGVSPMRFFSQLRAQEAARLLKATELPVPDVAAALGFADPYYFKVFFARYMGVRPETYRDVIIRPQDLR